MSKRTASAVKLVEDMLFRGMVEVEAGGGFWWINCDSRTQGWYGGKGI